MAYCVKCGVELQKSLENCPLCNTPVMLESYQADKTAELYPDDLDSLEQRFILKLFIPIFSLLLLIPMLISLTIDVFSNAGLSWSLIVSLSISFVWLSVVTPIWLRKKSPVLIISVNAFWVVAFLLGLQYITGLKIWSVYAGGAVFSIWLTAFIPIFQRRFFYYWSVLLDFLIILGYLFLVDIYSAEPYWFFPLACPIILYLLAATTFVIFLFHRKVKAMQITAAIFALVGLLNVVVDISVTSFVYGSFGLIYWSLIVLMPCFIIATVLLILSFQSDFVHELRRRLHV